MATGFPLIAQGVLFPNTQEPGGNRVTQAPRDRGITCRSGRLRSLSAVLMRELRPTADSSTWMAGRQHCWDFQVPAPNGRASSKSATKLTPVQVRNSRLKVTQAAASVQGPHTASRTEPSSQEKPSGHESWRTAMGQPLSTFPRRAFENVCEGGDKKIPAIVPFRYVSTAEFRLLQQRCLVQTRIRSDSRFPPWTPRRCHRMAYNRRSEPDLDETSMSSPGNICRTPMLAARRRSRSVFAISAELCLRGFLVSQNTGRDAPPPPLLDFVRGCETFS